LNSRWQCQYQSIELKFPHCDSSNTVKNGHSKTGAQRYRCKKCISCFKAEYTYKAWQPGIKEQIEKQTLNSGGVRDISRNPEISKNTVISELKKKLRMKSILTL
jgi:transposase